MNTTKLISTPPGVLKASTSGDTSQTAAMCGGDAKDEQLRLLNAQLDQLRLVADGVPASICYVDTEFRFQFVNATQARWYAKTAEEISGSLVRDIIGTATFVELKPHMLKALAGQSVKYETERAFPDGVSRIIDVQYAPHRDAGGSIVGFIVQASDVTQKHRAEAERQASERQLRLITDAMPAMIAYCNDDLVYTFMNATVKTWYGRSRDELVGSRMEDLLPPEVYARVRPWADKALAGETVTFSGERAFADGILRNLSTIYIPDRVPGGAVRGFFVLVLDVTAQHSAEAEARVKAQQLQLITDAVPALIAYCDRDRRYRFANKMAATLYDRPTEDIIGKRAEELIGEEAVQALLPYAARAFTGEEVSFEGARTFNDGKFRHHQTTYVPDRDDDGTVKGIFLLLIDITRRKQAEERAEAIARQLKLVIDGMPAMISYCDRDQRYRVVNRTMSEWLGRPEEDILGQTVRQVFGKQNYERMSINVDKVLAGNRMELEAARLFPDGRTRMLDVTLIPDMHDDGSVQGWFSLSLDITERKRARQLIERQKSELEVLNRQKDQLFSIIAHDLKGTFNGILGYSDLLTMPQTAANSETVTLYAGLLHEAGQQAYQILSDLLEWSRALMEAGEAETEDFDLNAVVERLLNTIEPQAIQAQVELCSQVPLTCAVRGDAEIVKTVLRNLLVNAIKFTPAGGKITLSAADDGGDIRIAVTDTGLGMDEETRSNLLHLGKHRSKSGVRGEVGTGLGLQICQELLKRFDATLSIDSALGSGSRFSFTLPAAVG